MGSTRKFYRTLVTVEILSEEPLDVDGCDEIHRCITAGDCSGSIDVRGSEQISAVEAAKLLKKQGSDPEFFRLDDHGNDLDDGYDPVVDSGIWPDA